MLCTLVQDREKTKIDGPQHAIQHLLNMSYIPATTTVTIQRIYRKILSLIYSKFVDSFQLAFTLVGNYEDWVLKNE